MPNKAYLFALLPYFVILTCEGLTNDRFSKSLGTLEWNKILTEKYFTEDFDLSLVSCAELCMLTVSCKSINYAPKYRQCQLNSETSIMNATKEKQGYIYSDIGTWDSSWVDQCASNICASNSRCQTSGEIQRCVLTECPHIPISNATFHTSIRNIGTGVKVSCDEGYTPKYEFVIQCEDNGSWSNVAKCKGIVTNVQEALVVIGRYSFDDLTGYSDDDKRNALISELQFYSSLTIADLQAKPTTASLMSLLGMADIFIFLRDVGVKSTENLGMMSDHDQRNTLIVYIGDITGNSIGYLQSLGDMALVRLGYSTF